MASVVLTGISANDPTPGNYVEVNFGVGPSGGFQGDYAILLVGLKTSAGSATEDTVVYGPSSSPPMQSEADVIALFGAGSELHREWRRVTKINTSTTVYAIAPTEGAGTAGSSTVTFSTTATAVGGVRFWCGDEFVDTSIASGDTVTNVGDALVTSINNQTHWPITAANSAGAVTVTSKNKGPRANEIRVRAAVIGSPSTTVSPNNTSTALTSGATEETWATALGTILPTRYYRIVSPSCLASGTNGYALCTQVTTQAQPANDIRQRVYMGATGTQAAASTIAAAINSPRCQIAHLYKSELTGGELAATLAAVHALFEERDNAWNFDSFGLGTQLGVDTSQYWFVAAPFTQSAWPTKASIKTALNNGLTPIGVTADGRTYIAMSCTTKHKNGSAFDYRVRESHIVNVCDHFADDIQAKYRDNFGGMRLGADPAPGQPLDPRVLVPRVIKSAIFGLIDEYDSEALLKNVATIKAGVQVIQNSDAKGRSGSVIPLQVIDLDHQNLIRIDDNSSATA